MPRRHSNSIQVPFFPTSWKHVREPSLWLEELSFDVTRATEWWKFYHVNGNVTAEFDRAPRGSFSSDIGDSEADPKISLDRSHIRQEGPVRFFPPPLLLFLFLVCTEAERGPAGYAATVCLHPRVWRLGLHRRARGRRGRARNGEREAKRRKSVNEVSELFALGPLSGSGLQLEKLRLPSAVGANSAISQRPPWSNFVVFCLFVYFFFNVTQWRVG